MCACVSALTTAERTAEHNRFSISDEICVCFITFRTFPFVAPANGNVTIWCLAFGLTIFQHAHRIYEYMHKIYKYVEMLELIIDVIEAKKCLITTMQTVLMRQIKNIC